MFEHIFHCKCSLVKYLINFVSCKFALHSYSVVETCKRKKKLSSRVLREKLNISVCSLLVLFLFVVCLFHSSEDIAVDPHVKPDHNTSTHKSESSGQDIESRSHAEILIEKVKPVIPFISRPDCDCFQNTDVQKNGMEKVFLSIC